MQIFENVRLALSGLKSNKMRALLTMLGIIIGIGSVIAIVTVGNSLTNSITSEMASIGVTNIQVMLAEKESDFSDPRAAMMGGTVRVTESDRITEDMIESYRAAYSADFEAIGASKSIGGGKATDGRKYANVDIYAAGPDQRIIDTLK